MPILKLGISVILLSCAVASVSQEPPQTSKPTSPAVSTLLVSARAKDGSADLTAADQEIKEDGKPVRIQQLRKLDQPPMRYCVLLDASNSERDQFKQQQQSAIRLLRQVVRPGTDRGWVSLFSVVSIES